MDDIALAFGWFFIALFLHAVFYRVFFRWKSMLFFLAGLYFLGIPLIILKHIFFPLPGLHLLITSCLVSFILSVIILLLYFPRFLNGQTPGAVLLNAFSKKSLWKKKELFDLFSEHELVDMRLQTLKEKHLIIEHNGVLFITKRGRVLSAFMSFWFSLIGMEAGG
jgi:hypothetical protein